MAFKIRNFAMSPFRQEENPKKAIEKDNFDEEFEKLENLRKNSEEKNVEYGSPEYERLYNEGSITGVTTDGKGNYRPMIALDEVDLGALKANKKIGESSIIDTSKGSSFPTGASTETLKQWYANNPPRDTIKDISKNSKDYQVASLTPTESVEDLKTLTGNPFDGIRAILRTDDSGGDFPTSLKDLRALKKLADRDDGSVNSEQAKSILSRSKGFNTASAFLPPILTADTAASLISGDPVAAILKKGKYIKPVSKILKKNKLGKKIYNSLDEVYYGYKGAKKLL